MKILIEGKYPKAPTSLFIFTIQFARAPTKPSGVGLPVLMPIIDEVDLVIYTYLVKSWILVGITALLWVGTFVYILKLAFRT